MACSIRPATYSDLPAIIRLYLANFGNEQLMDLLHPFRARYPADFRRFIHDMLTERWWTLGTEQCIEVLVAADGDGRRVVGFAWWRRSWQDAQRRKNTEGWLTLRRFHRWVFIMNSANLLFRKADGSLLLLFSSFNSAPSCGHTALPAQPWRAPRSGPYRLFFPCCENPRHGRRRGCC
jgi:hypothetical protein